MCGSAINVNSNVDAVACENITAEGECVPLCNEGYMPAEVMSFVCPADGGAVDLKEFECNPIPPGMSCAICTSYHYVAVVRRGSLFAATFN